MKRTEYNRIREKREKCEHDYVPIPWMFMQWKCSLCGATGVFKNADELIEASNCYFRGEYVDKPA